MLTRWGRTVGAVVLTGVLALGAAACGDDDGSGSGSREGRSSAVKAYRAGDSIDVRTGQTFVIALEANPTTGYSWSAAPNDDVTYVSSRQVQARNVPGAGGTQRLTFRATSTGSSTLVLNYARPFESNVPPVQTEKFPVTVTS